MWVTDETDWPTLLDAAAKAPALLERDGVVFRLELEHADITYGGDPHPDRVRQMLNQVAGS